MISGFFVENEIPTKQVVIEETTVRVMKQSAQPFSRNIVLKGSAEADKNVQQQLADIQATGGQRAYEQALAAYEADRGARVQEEQLRQQAFVTSEEARRAQQQLAVDTFRAGEDAKQQAARIGGRIGHRENLLLVRHR